MTNSIQNNISKKNKKNKKNKNLNSIENSNKDFLNDGYKNDSIANKKRFNVTITKSEEQFESNTENLLESKVPDQLEAQFKSSLSQKG